MTSCGERDEISLCKRSRTDSGWRNVDGFETALVAVEGSALFGGRAESGVLCCLCCWDAESLVLIRLRRAG